MTWEQLLFCIEDGVATITLNRPERLNAFTPTMRNELIEAFDRADRDDQVRVVIVTGSGTAFCAGADLSSGPAAFDRGMSEGRSIQIAEHRDGGGQVALAVYRCRKPVIAAINGHAVGIGMTMTLPMDMRIVAEDAKIGFPFTRRGVVPEACSSWFLPRIVGMARAAEWIYTGRVFRAVEASNSGLFNHILPKERVLEKARSIAKEISENTSAVSVALSRAMLWHGLSERDPQSVHLVDSRCFFYMGRSQDSYEGVASFLEKRAPQFSMKVSEDMPDFYPWWKEPKV